MRRKFVVTVIFILAFLLATAATAFAADEQYRIVRVKLSIGEPTEFSFFADGNYTIGPDGAGLERQQYTVKLEGGTLNLYCGLEKLASGASIKLVRHAATSGRNNFIWMFNAQAASDTNNNFKYVGDMEFLVEGGHIAAVNHVYIEDYLYGVVPSEMENSSHVEALKSQAVASRSYVEFHLRSSSATFDVYDTPTNSQVYKGYNELTNSKNAVDGTAKTVLTYGDQVIEALFGASNGGWTDIPLHVWNSPDVPYFQISQDDSDAANTSSLFETIYFPYAIDGAHPITASDNISDSQPNPGNAEAYIKQKIFESGQIQAAGQSVTSRNDFSLTGVTGLVMAEGNFDSGGTEDHSRTGGGGVCADRYVATGNFNVLVTASGAPVSVTNVALDLRFLDASNKIEDYKSFFKTSLTLFVVAPVKDGDTVLGYSISQKRFGHGIGLSQQGAKQRASVDGQTFNQILGFYYPGTTLKIQEYEAPTLSPASVPDHSNAALISDLVRVRSGPGTTYSTLNRLPNGSRIEVVQANAAVTGNINWHKIYYAGQYAYVAGKQGTSDYVLLDNPMTREPLTVNFATNGGSPVSVPAYYHADNIASAPASSKPNYNLEGWYFDEGLTSKVSYPYILTHNTTLYAKWTATPFSIGYDLRGGSASNPGSYTVESGAITLNNPSRNGYTFTGWTGTGLSGPTMSVTIPAGSSGNRAYYANWSPITYYISYNLNGGSNVSNPGSFTPESPGFMLANPIRPGYAFVGWTGTGLPGNTVYVNIPGGSTGNRDYTANWAPYACTINFDSQGGSPVGGMQRGLWDTIPSEPSTSRHGYNFAGWFTGSGERASFPYVVRDNATLYARWAQQPQTNLLGDVQLSCGSLNRGFAKTVTSYKITIGENDGSFTLTPVREYDGAAMTINGKPYSNYTVSLANGKSATITVKVTLAKKSKSYKFTVTRAKSSNNALSSLAVIGGSLNQPFDPNVLNYTLNLDENTKSTTLKAVAAAGKAASVSPSSKKISLNNGQSKDVKITVKAQSGAKRTYTVHVVRAASTNADLKSLKASGMAPGFSPGNTHYTVVLPANKSSASISAKAGGYKSVVYIDGAKKSSKKVALANGQSVDVRVTVVSQSGNAKEYVITVIRP